MTCFAEKMSDALLNLIIGINKQKNRGGDQVINYSPNISTKSYTKKMIRSGNVIEVIEYEKPVHTGFKSKTSTGRSVSASDDEHRENRRKVMQRAKNDIRRLINANVDAWGQTAKFLTLTFAENITDLHTANYEFKKFRQRLEYKIGCKLKYVVVVEFQKRGAIHYHAVFFNLPYIPSEDLAVIWRNGFIRVNAIDSVDNIGAYVTKYMTKEQYDEEKEDKLKGQKSYFSSRGLKKPEEIYEQKEIEQLEATLSKHKVYESNFSNDYLGQITYSQFNTKR